MNAEGRADVDVAPTALVSKGSGGAHLRGNTATGEAGLQDFGELMEGGCRHAHSTSKLLAIRCLYVVKRHPGVGVQRCRQDTSLAVDRPCYRGSKVTKVKEGWGVHDGNVHIKHKRAAARHTGGARVVEHRHAHHTAQDTPNPFFW